MMGQQLPTTTPTRTRPDADNGVSTASRAASIVTA